MAVNGVVPHTEQPNGHQNGAAPTAAEPKADIPKDEVGWYFVEQYYTTLSRSPEKLHLFYNRKSQFVSGVETEKVDVSVGQKAIAERIKALDLHDAKVRVLNVDAQASFDNIIIAVIGEMSNKSEPPRKFVQTFVLAEQPNGYYVLNDIIRYLAEDEEAFEEEAPAAEAAPAEEEEAEAEVQPEPEAEPEKIAAEPEVAEHQVVDDEASVEQVSQKLEEVAKEEEVEEPAADATSTDETVAEPTPESSVSEKTAEADGSTAEKPQEPEPTPAVSPKPAAAAPVKESPAAKPAAPKSWAALLGNTRVATPVIPQASSTSSATSAPVKEAPAPAASAPAPKETAAAKPKEAATTGTATPGAETGRSSPASNSGWQTAGDHGKRQPRQQSVSNPKHTGLQAYVKNVNDRVDASLLKQALSAFGKLEYFDVSRVKSCAFVEFSDVASFHAAVAANPITVGSEEVTIEERRTTRNNFGQSNNFNNSNPRGNGRNRDGPGRGSFQRDGRGGFPNRGRNNNNAANKGRTQPQAA